MKNDSKKATKKATKKVVKKVAKPDKVVKRKYTRRTPKAEQITDLNLGVSVIGPQDNSAGNPQDLSVEGNAMNQGTHTHTLLEKMFSPSIAQFFGGEHFVVSAETKASNQRVKVINAICELVEATMEMQKSTERSAGELEIATAVQNTAAIKVEVALDAFEATIRNGANN